MRIPLIITAGAMPLAVLAVIAAADANDADRCSINPFPGGRAEQEAVLLGAALPDTVEAGAGGVEPSGYAGHVGRGGPGPIFGQVIEVARHAGADSIALARAFDRNGSRRVVIVPWDYDSACRPARWSVGSAWVSVSEPAGVFTVRLRPESDWAGGLPTFDAFMADFEPYPHGLMYRRGYRGMDSLRTAPSLTAAEYFDMLRAIPSWGEVTAGPDSAWAAIVAWQQANPDAAAKYPATRMVFWLGVSIANVKARAALRMMEPVIAGTWRFVFALDGGPERVFHARTRRSPTTDWRDFRSVRQPVDPAAVPARPEGYHLIASGALTADSLLTGCDPGERTMGREGYIAALEPAPVAGAEVREWSGLVDLRLLEHQFPHDAGLRRFAVQQMREGAARYREEGRWFAPARLVLGDDGVMRVEQTVELADGSRVALRGERVSMAVIACDGSA